LAYLAIPTVLVYFVRRRRDMPFPAMFWLFGAFILGCGLTHFMEVITSQVPVYRLAGLVKLVTALASWATVVALVRVIPLALRMRSPEELEREIEERRQAEEEIRRLNKELEQRIMEVEAANGELEAFSYSVSHDLRAPLRAMAGFSRIVLEEHGPTLAAEAERYLRLVQQNAQHMGDLIDHLLRFSRLSRQPLKVQAVAPAELVRQVLGDLRPEHEGRTIDLSIGDLPHCKADPALLKQVFVNLLANAFKYTRGRERAVIEVGGRRDDQRPGENIYFVKDNGVGFDMRYAHKLFAVFQRLHRAEDFEGTGVGLATVQRIIHRHGGRVWAEAGVNRGATFYCSLERDTSHA
jgi:light-regulated signal transduction histidine kinase (bacteriophytochrome)